MRAKFKDIEKKCIIESKGIPKDVPKEVPSNGCHVEMNIELLGVILKDGIFISVCDLLTYRYWDLIMLPESRLSVVLCIHFLDLQRNSRLAGLSVFEGTLPGTAF